MPLVKITTKPKFHPTLKLDGGTANQKMTAEFARDLPGLFIVKAKKLRLDGDTPETAVQVTHHKFHTQDVYAPDMWIEVQFTESGLSELKRNKVTGQVKKIILGWYSDNDAIIPPNIALDIFWGPSHGFNAHYGNTTTEW